MRRWPSSPERWCDIALSMSRRFALSVTPGKTFSTKSDQAWSDVRCLSILQRYVQKIFSTKKLHDCRKLFYICVQN